MSNDFASAIFPDLAWDDPLRPPPGSWQGITRVELEILPPPAAPDEPAAQLKVHLFTFGSGYSVRISGPNELPFTLVAVGNPILIDLPELGGRGTYYVTLVPLDFPFPPLHPFFATASFNFIIDCELGDCHAREGVNPLVRPSETAPAVDLLTKDFDGFLQLLGDRVRIQNPDWADFAPASFERVLLELLAYHGDMLSYYQDRVANEAFVDTASQRFSVRQHGLLLGYELFDGAAASAVLSFDVAPPDGQPVSIPAKLAVSAELRPDEAPVAFSVTNSALVFSEKNSTRLIPAQWPEAFTARIPAGATSMLLFGNVSGLEIGQRIALLQRGVKTQIRLIQRIESLELRGWVADPNQSLNAFTPVQLTRVYWDEGLAFALQVWEQATPVPGVPPHGVVPLEIHANLVDARHGNWKNARLRNAPTDLDDFNPDIRLTPQSAVVTDSPLGATRQPHLRALRLPDAPLLFDRIGEELVPAVEVSIDGHTWFRQSHLWRSQPFDRHYVVATDNDGRAWLMFGDGRRGRPVELDVGSDLDLGTARIKEGSTLQVSYRVGAPLAGNIDVGKLATIPRGQLVEGLDVEDLRRVLSVRNITPGVGGEQAESLDAARFAIPASLRSWAVQRAVTPDDYARLAEAADPRVARAIVRSQGGLFATVRVLVDVKDQAELDENLRAVLERALERGRMVGREVLVQGAEDVPLDVELAVCVKLGFSRYAVKLAVLDALRPGDSARPGFFHPNRLSFGQEVELSDLIAETQRVAGVLAVKAIKFCRLGTNASAVLQRISLGSTEVARLDANELDPENGRLIVRIVGLDQIPDDLFDVAQSTSVQGGVA